MTLPSIQLVTEAVYQLLIDAGDLTVYRSRVEPALDIDSRGVLKGHAVFHPLTSMPERSSMAGPSGSVLLTVQVDCVGGSQTYLLEVVDKVIDRLDGKTVTVDGATSGLIQPPVGYHRLLPYRDPGGAPFQLRLPLQYQVLAVPA